MKSFRVYSFAFIAGVALATIAPITSIAADAAWVGGDMKVDGIWFSDDPSKTVIRKPSDFSSPWTILGSDIYYLTGNVGIGTMTPATKLDVNGTVTATGFNGNGSGLSSVSAATVVDGAVTDIKITGPISADKLDLSGVQKKYGRVAVVAKSGGDYDDPAKAMTEYATWCKDLAATSPCLLKIMPGEFTVTSPVVMHPYIDIEGSGEKVTKITSGLSSASQFLTVATVMGTNNAELRFLTVENVGTGEYTAAILNISASPSILHVTATSNGAISLNHAIYNFSTSSPTMTSVTASATGGSSGNYAIFSGTSSSPTMTSVTASASGGTNANMGIVNAGNPSTLTNVTATAKGGVICYGVHNSYTQTTMTNVTVSVSGGTGNTIGVNSDHSYQTMTSVTISASGGTGNVGIKNSVGGTVIINNSAIKGSTNTIVNAAGGITLVGNTKLDGGAVSNAGTLTCAGVYDENYVFYASTCP